MWGVSKKWTEFSIMTGLALLTTILFWDGNLDINAAGFFYQSENADNSWPLGKFWLWKTLYEIAFPSVVLVASIAILIILSGFIRRLNRRFRNRAIYFVLVILLGPGVMVNLVLKDHWGRPRPREIIEFNGNYTYQPAVVVGESDRKSFVCGHCSTGYIFFALYFILQKGRTWMLLATIVYSLLMGIARMTAGGHFVSDILWSGYVVFAVSWFLYYFVFREFEQDLEKISAD